jgi:tetratricopeptide (TPR) repeat protein
MRRLGALTAVVVLLGCLVPAARADEKELTAKERREVAQKADRLNREGMRLYGEGKATAALSRFDKALAIRQKLYPKDRYPRGHLDLAVSLNNLGSVLEKLGRADKALLYLEQAVAMFQKLYPKEKFPQGHPALAYSLNNLGGVLQVLGRADKALPYFERALAMRQKLYPR